MYVRQRSSRTLSVLAIALTVAMVWPVALAPAAGKSNPRSKAEYSRSQFLVKFKPGTSGAKIASINRAERVTQRANIKQIGVRVLNVPKGKSVEQMVAKYKKNKNVEFAEVDAVAKASATPNDPYFWLQWAHPYVNSEEAWSVTTGSPAETIAILDTGIDMSHPEMADRVVAGYDFINNDTDPSDDNGHGTRAAGIAAATGDNGTGVAGMDWQARVMSVKVLDSTGSGSASTVAKGIIHAADQGARVLSMSFGGPSSSTMLSAVRYAYGRGCVQVAATGNESSGTPLYPAGYAEVIAVGSVTHDVLSTFSNYGSHIDVVAPGEGIDTTVMGGKYGRFAGTSAATPFVAGLASLILSAAPGSPPNTVMSAITSSARDLGTAGWDAYYGWGHIDAGAALAVVGGEAPEPLTKPEPTPTPTPVDVAVPEVEVTSPTSGSYVSGTVAVEALASDDTGVAKVEFWIDGKLLGTDTTAPYALGWNTSKTANGEYSVYARAIDTVGKSTSSAKCIVKVSNVPKGRSKK